MKSLLIVLLLIAAKLFAQEFTVEKVGGDVQALIGSNEKWTELKAGQKLLGTDLISTGEKSFLQVSDRNNHFVLQENSALRLSSYKKMTLNELLLALATEEIRNIPKSNNNPSTRNTAVYGKDAASVKPLPASIRDLGFKKLNGAKQLAQNGFKESAIVVAKETFRKYPETKTKVKDHLYFVDLLIQLKLYREAESELIQIKEQTLNDIEKVSVDARSQKIKSELINKQ